MTSLDDVALVDVRPGARWPWVALAAGAAIVTVGGFAFSPEQPVSHPADSGDFGAQFRAQP